ncbi:hypothetical protein [Acinetobacter pseudolwoffii]|uniref:Uncharacterized protein n=1 Tax=Acinetobacter pseudolwoffii TaxID=2053287 RepID=A0A2H9YP62_9GAMM|nr:hypothetical protein [Acinetobacter pseudolwoffii]PJO74436.1 hypothetical protein CWI32_13555 [Acinetobacter pseudolwoffii]
MKDFLKRIFGQGKNLPPKLPKHMEMKNLTVGSIPPPIPSNKGSGLPISSLPPPFPKGAFVAGGMGFGVLPPPFPTTAVVDTWSKKPALAKNSDFDDNYPLGYQTIDPNEDPTNPLRHAFDTWSDI